MLFSLAVIAALLPLQAQHHLRLAGFPAEWPARAGAVLVLAGAMVALMTPGVLAGFLLERLGARRAVVAGAAWSSAVALWVVLDLLVHGQTGNRLGYYFKFALQPDALRWAGNREGLLGLFGRPGTSLALYLAGTLAVAILVTRRVRLGSGTARWLQPVLLSIWLATLAGGPVLQRFTADPRAFIRLNDTMPVPWHLGFALSTDLLAATERRAAEVFRRYHDRLGALPVVPADVPEPAGPLPNVIVVVVDGLRRDVLTPAIMPRILGWSERGARFTAHVAAANGSEWGTFGMLYGLTPFAFVPIVDSGVPPTLLSVLWRWGYETHFVTSGTDFGWLLIGKYLGPRFFEVYTQPRARPGWENDRDSIATLRRVLGTGGAPKFVFVWLAATHWLYSSPEEYRAFTPDLGITPAADVVTQRWQAVWSRFYGRAARYVDDLVGEWLEGLDLTRNLVVFTADHGEALYDDGFVGHGPRLSAAEIEVPFVLAGPGVTPGTVVHAPSGNFDLAPTLLHVLGDGRSAEQTMFGRSLLPAERERPPYAVAYRPVDESAVGLSGSLSVGDTLREVVFVSDEARYGIRLDPKAPAVSRFGLMDARGAVTGEAITAAEAERFLRWFEEVLARSARLGESAPSARP
jgi:hypothetical protein